MFYSLFTLALVWSPGFRSHESVVRAAENFQVPLSPETSHILGKWDSPPHHNATGNHLFSSASSLLQRWPNTMWRNGHTIVPAVIPIGTMMHHGTIVSSGAVPTEREWLGFDFEVGYLYCGKPCRVVSFAATRDLKVLYFDGLSAAKTPNSSHLETQDVITWGEIRHDRIHQERKRINVLCAWGRDFGIDGFVRMQWQFEIMYCNFTDGLKVAEVIDLIPQNKSLVLIGQQQPPPVGWKGTLMDGREAFVNTLASGAWHNQYPGEPHVRIDYTSILSFYDPSLLSLVRFRHGQPRKHHRLFGISESDISLKLAELEDILIRDQRGSGLDWTILFRGIYDRYADRLDILNHTLWSTSPDLEALRISVRSQLLAILAPYMSTSDVPRNPADLSWLAPVVERCERTPATGITEESFTRQERLIRNAVRETMHEICRRLAFMWSDALDIEGTSDSQTQLALGHWKAHISELMEWLDWSIWNRCRPGCATGDMCYISTWPHPFPEDDFDNLTPRCISQRFFEWPIIKYLWSV